MKCKKIYVSLKRILRKKGRGKNAYKNGGKIGKKQIEKWLIFSKKGDII